MPVDCYCWRQWLSSLSRTELPKSPLTYLLFCVFGIGSWVAINGVWSEISILVLILPECEKLPAMLVVVIQLANIGPLAYVAVKYIFRRRKQLHLEIVTVFVLVVVGIIACVLLAVFWSKTANIFGSPHSVALIVLTFILALVDCTSSVVFIPFMKHFPAVYMSGLYIGEGLSGVLPSVVALIQGSVNNSIHCTKSYTGYEALGIRFSPSVFFMFLAIMLLLCGLAFLAINVLPMVRKHMITQEPHTVLDTSAAQQSQRHTMVDKESKTEEAEQQQSDSEIEHSDDDTDELSPFKSPDKQSEDPSVHISEHNPRIQSPQTHQPSVRSVLSIIWSNLSILICLALINFLTNGALNSISSFVFLPYGNTVYHVAINLGILAYPIASLFALVPLKSKSVTAILTAAACLLAVYELVVALLSPNPPLKDTIGGPIIVIVHVTICALVAYTKVGIAVQLHVQGKDRDTALLLAGIVTQLGAMLGAVIFFVLVYFTNIFKFV